jgi:hypothetical protein
MLSAGLTGAACASASSPSGATSTTVSSHPARAGAPVAAPPRHTVIVMTENHSYGDVIGSPAAPYLNWLARHGASFTSSHAITHPSEPNYLALFSGSTHGVTDDSCPHTFRARNLGSQLIAAGRTFAGYSEGLPNTGSGVCSAGEYARKHVPWTNFPSVPAQDSKPFSAYPAGHYAALATVSFVIPDLCHDMHDCSVAAGDAWLKKHAGPYRKWAMSHHSLLVVDWDEGHAGGTNQIPTIFAGQMIKPGTYRQWVSHYSVLRTIESLYRLSALGLAAIAHVITGIWK